MDSNRLNHLEYLSSPLLATPHGFSTRLGGVSEGHLASLNLGHRRGDDPENVRENYRRFCAATGTDHRRVVMTNQVHGDVVRRVTEGDVKPDLLSPCPFEADGLVTDLPGVTLVIFSADCIPLLLFDPAARVIAAAHAGWRGTAAAICQKAVAAMEALGAEASQIRAAIGPGIGPCCFETHADVPHALTAALGGELVRPFVSSPFPGRDGEKYRVDLKGLNAALLREAGVTQIDIAQDCTCCLPDKYWSHRYTGGIRGSQAAVIMLEEVAG